MNYYAGLDVSLEETGICVVDADGKIVREMRAASEPAALEAALRATGLPLERIGLEACSLAAWLHDGLRDVSLLAVEPLLSRFAWFAGCWLRTWLYRMLREHLGGLQGRTGLIMASRHQTAMP